MVCGVHVRRPGVASLTLRRCDLTPETQYTEEEESNPVWAFAQLRRLGLGLMTVSHENLASSVPCVPHTSAHTRNHNQLAKLVPGPLGGNTMLPQSTGL